MVEIKSMEISNKSFLGIHLHMPGYPMYFIMSTKTILAQNMFDIHRFQREHSNVSVILTDHHFGLEKMLQARVVAMNEVAMAHGVTLSMNGEEAILLCESEAQEA